MKRIICLILCGLLLLGIIMMPILAAEVNRCDELKEKASMLMFYGLEKVLPGESFPVQDMMQFTFWRIDNVDQYGQEGETQDGQTFYRSYRIPAAVLEGKMQTFFANIDFDALHTVQMEFSNPQSQYGWELRTCYQPDTQEYLLPYFGGAGDVARYVIQGYEVTDNIYTAYLRFERMHWGEGAPEGVEGVDYVKDADGYWIIGYYLKAGFLQEETLKYYSWEKSDTPFTTGELILPDVFTGVVEQDDLTVEAEPEVFPENTVLEIAPVDEETDPEQFAVVEQALEAEYEDYVAYDVSAICKDAPVQPNGKVTLRFTIPETFDTARTVVLYIDDAGKVEQLEGVIEGNEICVETDHFSCYAVAMTQPATEPTAPATEAATTPATEPDQNAPTDNAATDPTAATVPEAPKETCKLRLFNWLWLVLAAIVLIVGIILVWLQHKKKKEEEKENNT